MSASAEEMSAQVEEVTTSAQSLADMAVALQQVVAQFRLDQDFESGRTTSPVRNQKLAPPTAYNPAGGNGRTHKKVGLAV